MVVAGLPKPRPAHWKELKRALGAVAEGRVAAEETSVTAARRQVCHILHYYDRDKVAALRGYRQLLAEAVAKGVLRWSLKTRGRAFALFTSDELLQRTAAALRGPLEEAGLTLLAQGGDLTRRAMLENFRKNTGFVLFGLDSFWMGVDVRGEALSNVILTRLPFAVPDHPVVAARLRRIKEKGGDPFKEYSLPEAVLKFRQGFGRLIRS